MRFILLLLLGFAGASCQSHPQANFHYLNTSVANGADVPVPAPESSGFMVDLRLAQGAWHFHPEAEEWLTVLEGNGTLYLGPDHQGGVDPKPMRTYPLARGDVFLIPRNTLHCVEGPAQLLLIYSGPNCTVNDGFPETVTW